MMVHLRPFIMSRGRGQHQHSTDGGLSDDNAPVSHSSLHCLKYLLFSQYIDGKLSEIKVKPTKSGENVNKLLMKIRPTYLKTA